ncbi:MAG TPA: flagellar export protein FliJ [Tepidisphaeraceae bacterium]|jgi:flagellar FliJ protein|nr:flagellar export protein FliJ [Tepidisphaeraceae bacterium]
MPKFVFQLDGVLRQRTHVEQQRKRELATVQTQMAVLDAELRALDGSVRAAEEDLRQNRLVGRIDLAFLAAHRRYAFAMQRKAMGIAQKMSGVQIQLDKAQRNLAEAAKQKKILGKLRERRFARWREEVERRDLLEMDEIAMRLGHHQIGDAELGDAELGDAEIGDADLGAA